MSEIHQSSSEALPSDHASNEKKKPNSRPLNLIWDTLDKSPEERKFLFKLDAGFLTIACLGTLHISPITWAIPRGHMNLTILE
jgi:hypothetical protein